MSERAFQADVAQILSMVTNSLYSHPDIFLREVISNSADALDKVRFLAMTDVSLMVEPSIILESDETSGTLRISDNGVGMSHDELIQNLGTIAHSGTRDLLKSLQDKTNPEHTQSLIGQFGVGFYAVFIVAQKVVVRSRAVNTQEAYEWESNGIASYTLRPSERATVGTDVILHMKPEHKEYLEEWKIRSIVEKYSNHIAAPILFRPAASDKDYTVKINKGKAFWLQPKKDLTVESYHEFFKNTFGLNQAPATYLHAIIEGKHCYTLLLFVPNENIVDTWRSANQPAAGIKLYVRGVFITDDATQFLPSCLRFVRGVVDAPDAPLNVSREMLQHDDLMSVIRASATKRILDALSSMTSDAYSKFWSLHGHYLKEGLLMPTDHTEQLMALLRFTSTHHAFTNLADYITRMKPNQIDIYYLLCESHDVAKIHPLLDVFRQKDIEVLLLTDTVDIWIAPHLKPLESHTFVSVSDGKWQPSTLDIFPDQHPSLVTSATPTATDVISSECLTCVETFLKGRVGKVRAASYTMEAPCCLVASADAQSCLHTQRYLSKHAEFQSLYQQQTLPELVLNPKHSFVKRLQIVMNDEQQAMTWAEFLYGQAVLADGGRLESTASFIKALNVLMASAV
jgi:molecular chaperone HtpG